MATMMGSDVTKFQIEWQFRRYRAGAKLQQAAVAAGQDPKNVNVDVNPKGGTLAGQTFFFLFRISFQSPNPHRTAADIPDLSKYFGQDSTPGGMGFQFRTLKQYAKRQKACADAGGDPQTLGIGSGGGGQDSSTLLHLLSSQAHKKHIYKHDVCELS
jgi:hypothetical protein